MEGGLGKVFCSDFEAREIICEIGRRMYNRNYVAANDGNISIRCSEHAIWATPTGVSKGFMSPEMLVKLDLEGNVIEGYTKPSSEIKMHLKVYNENIEVGAVVHAHPPVATAFSVVRKELQKPVLPEAIVLLGCVPVAEYGMPGSDEVPEAIKPYCKTNNALLLANHGALTWGRDGMEAYFRMESLEHYATVLMHTKTLGGAVELNKEQIESLIELRTSMGINSGGVPMTEEK